MPRQQKYNLPWIIHVRSKEHIHHVYLPTHASSRDWKWPHWRAAPTRLSLPLPGDLVQHVVEIVCPRRQEQSMSHSRRTRGTIRSGGAAHPHSIKQPHRNWSGNWEGTIGKVVMNLASTQGGTGGSPNVAFIFTLGGCGDGSKVPQCGERVDSTAPSRDNGPKATA